MTDEMGELGLDVSDPVMRLALDMTRADRRLIDKLVEVRQRRFTQTEMAELMGVSQSAVAKFESGTRDPKLSTIRRYALALQVRIAHTVDGEDCTEFDTTATRESTRGVRAIEMYLSTNREEPWEPVRVPKGLTFDTSSGPIQVKP